MFHYLPNELIFDFLLLLDLPTLINFLCTQKRFSNLYQDRFEYFWFRKYQTQFKSLIPDELALSFFDKYRLALSIINPPSQWTLINSWGTNCNSLAVFTQPNVTDVHQYMLNSGHYSVKKLQKLKHLLPTHNPNNYTFKESDYELIKVPLYTSLTPTDSVYTSFGYLDGDEDYYNVIANFNGFSHEQIFHLLAFIFNLGSKEEGDIVDSFSDMLYAYNEDITSATAKDVEEALYESKIGGGHVKYVFYSFLQNL